MGEEAAARVLAVHGQVESLSSPTRIKSESCWSGAGDADAWGIALRLTDPCHNCVTRPATASGLVGSSCLVGTAVIRSPACTASSIWSRMPNIQFSNVSAAVVSSSSNAGDAIEHNRKHTRRAVMAVSNGEPQRNQSRRASPKLPRAVDHRTAAGTRVHKRRSEGRRQCQHDLATQSAMV
jgi:hypothetical protein